ncbi:uncharacterized protein BDR25DRAFT_356533 [Lindgomyces ingoldianus]|uniref:Uncharacterized protein n=1 Tax=Lindgomyces ingoldianus TaxID=673940 RepID=A0ACB6QQU1_9PLEO|nr:uncharacterized protein BDR25DRAFT_356533 [Lindgomyces ingoldianus]KAF2469291.1 hypothetical protein BDR25DRAFT_356533 [Lindgomyces ingoldianus]
MKRRASQNKILIPTKLRAPCGRKAVICINNAEVLQRGRGISWRELGSDSTNVEDERGKYLSNTTQPFGISPSFRIDSNNEDNLHILAPTQALPNELIVEIAYCLRDSDNTARGAIKGSYKLDNPDASNVQAGRLMGQFAGQHSAVIELLTTLTLNVERLSLHGFNSMTNVMLNIKHLETTLAIIPRTNFYRWSVAGYNGEQPRSRKVSVNILRIRCKDKFTFEIGRKHFFQLLRSLHTDPDALKILSPVFGIFILDGSREVNWKKVFFFLRLTPYLEFSTIRFRKGYELKEVVNSKYSLRQIKLYLEEELHMGIQRDVIENFETIVGTPKRLPFITMPHILLGHSQILSNSCLVHGSGILFIKPAPSIALTQEALPLGGSLMKSMQGKYYLIITSARTPYIHGFILAPRWSELDSRGFSQDFRNLSLACREFFSCALEILFGTLVLGPSNESALPHLVPLTGTLFCHCNLLNKVRNPTALFITFKDFDTSTSLSDAIKVAIDTLTLNTNLKMLFSIFFFAFPLIEQGSIVDDKRHGLSGLLTPPRLITYDNADPLSSIPSSTLSVDEGIRHPKPITPESHSEDMVRLSATHFLFETRTLLSSFKNLKVLDLYNKCDCSEETPLPYLFHRANSGDFEDSSNIVRVQYHDQPLQTVARIVRLQHCGFPSSSLEKLDIINGGDDTTEWVQDIVDDGDGLPGLYELRFIIVGGLAAGDEFFLAGIDEFGWGIKNRYIEWYTIREHGPSQPGVGASIPSRVRQAGWVKEAASAEDVYTNKCRSYWVVNFSFSIINRTYAALAERGNVAQSSVHHHERGWGLREVQIRGQQYLLQLSNLGHPDAAAARILTTPLAKQEP